MSSDEAALCVNCGPTRPVIVRPGVARAREDLAFLTGLEVAEIGRRRPGLRRPRRRARAHRDRGGAAPGFPASVVVFLDFDNELLAARFPLGEQALALLALASRLLSGRRRQGRVVVRTG